MEPFLAKTLEMSHELADFFPGYEHIADPLIDFSDYGMKVSALRLLFDELRAQLVPLVETITSQPAADDSCLHQSFPEDAQLAFGVEVAKRLGYDFERGRQDKTHHPFTITFSIGDVRITTRAKENDLTEALFSTVHEAGHAIYEQGIDEALEGTSLADGTSSGVHESQSRLWENLVGRSKEFWEFFYPGLQSAFPDQLGAVSQDTFYRAINKVQRSLIRTDADEVTYNLHVMIRFGLELEMLEGKLLVADLPDAWRESYERDLGITPPDDRDGVLQDMHWFASSIGGGFQGYTLGNILSAQFFEGAMAAHPDIRERMRKGDFVDLHGWLTENVYRYGSKFTPPELVEKSTGGALKIEPYIRYLKSKFGELYAL
jgi:carboxypeptidase Taq